MEGAPLAADPTPAEADPYRPAAGRAVEYLAVTDAEMGVDVLASLQIYGALRGHLGALEVAELRRDAPRPGDLERYGLLLEIDKPPLPPAALGDVAPSATTPDPADVLEDDRIARCLDEVLTCAVSPECVDYVELDDRWGYVLTHQAVTLIFARWVGCPLDVDVEERRRTFAANLLAAQRADPTPSDLAYERLAMIGHLGFADEIDPAWLDALTAAQAPDGCFPTAPGEPCHPHATGVALWALAHAP